VTGVEPALETLPAASATNSDTLAAATSAAIAHLESNADVASSGPTPMASSVQSADVPAVTDSIQSPAVVEKRAASTPDALAGRNPIEISSACSKIVGSSTPTVTVTSAASTATSYRRHGNFPAKCLNSSPAKPFAGDFVGSHSSLDDNVYTITLPFAVCIYGT
jgi:hypothetical protein